MAGFGAAVESLVETYTRCLRLLEKLHLGGGDEQSAHEQKARLGSQVRSDRSLIRRTYRSKLSRRGSAFEVGDAPATSSLKRVARKLRAALTAAIALLARDRARPKSLDYASLTTVSTDTRRDALRTMTSLSARLSLPKGDVGSRASRGTTSSTSKGSRRTRRGEGASSSPSGKSRSREKVGRPRQSRDHQREAHQHCLAREKKRKQGSRRFSSATFSSQSTKLGEIRPRRRGGGEHGDSWGYHAEVTYPLPYPWVDAVEAPGNDKRSKGRFWGLFGRR